MAAERRVRRGVAVVALVALALLLTGLVFGEIGRKLAEQFLGVEVPPLVEAPQVHLPAANLLHPGEEAHPYEMPQDPLAFAFTNTMLSSLLTTAVLLLLFLPVGLRARLVPGRLQSIVESFIEWMMGFCEAVAGHRGRTFFPIIATIFLFVAFNAWMGLLPFYPALVLRAPESGALTSITLLRPAGTDVNMPLALALFSFVFVEFWGLRELGVHYLGKFFRFGNLLRGLATANLSRVFQGVIDLFVGFLELMSEFIRIVSFTFRLFGNMTAGEILLLVVTFLVPFVAIMPFYGLELLVGFVQALIFAGLTLVFAALAIQPHAEEEHH